MEKIKKFNHKVAFLSALRNALIVLSGLIIYEFLRDMVNVWDKLYYHKKVHHLYYKKTYQLIGIFIIDLIILYSVFYFFNIELY